MAPPVPTGTQGAAQNFHGATTVLNVHNGGTVTVNNYFGAPEHGTPPSIPLSNPADVPRPTTNNDNNNKADSTSVPAPRDEPETAASSSTTRAARSTGDHLYQKPMPMLGDVSHVWDGGGLHVLDPVPPPDLFARMQKATPWWLAHGTVLAALLIRRLGLPSPRPRTDSVSTSEKVATPGLRRDN